MYRGSPTYAVFTTADPTTVIFGLCLHKWGIFRVSRGPPNANFALHIFFQVPKSVFFLEKNDIVDFEAYVPGIIFSTKYLEQK